MLLCFHIVLNIEEALSDEQCIILLFCLTHTSLLLKLIFIGIQLLYNVVLVCTVQENKSVIHIHISPLLGLPWSHRSALSRVHCAHYLSILYIVSIVYMYQSQFSQLLATFPPWYTHICSLYLYLCTKVNTYTDSENKS